MKFNIFDLVQYEDIIGYILNVEGKYIQVKFLNSKDTIKVYWKTQSLSDKILENVLIWIPDHFTSDLKVNNIKLIKRKVI